MATRFLSLFLTLAVWVVSGHSLAHSDSGQDVLGDIIAPDIERRDIKEGKIDTENWEVGVFVGAMSIEDFGTGTVLGARVAYHVTEDFFAEVAFGATEAGVTSFELLSGATEILTDDQRDLTYVTANLGYNIFQGEIFIGKKYAFNTNLYLHGGVGNTDFAQDNFLTFSAGVGTRLFFTDWFSLHGGVRGYTFSHEILGPEIRVINVEPSIGLTIFF